MITPGHLSVALLTVSFFLGVIQLGRCFALSRILTHQRPQAVLIAFWVVLLSFITHRMATTLGLV